MILPVNIVQYMNMWINKVSLTSNANSSDRIQHTGPFYDQSLNLNDSKLLEVHETMKEPTDGFIRIIPDPNNPNFSQSVSQSVELHEGPSEYMRVPFWRCLAILESFNLKLPMGPIASSLCCAGHLP